MGLIGDLVVRLTGDTKQFQSSIRKSEKAIKAFGQSAVKIGRSLSTFVTLPILGIGTAFAKVAADAEEVNSKFDTVFKSQAASVRVWAKTFSQATGRSTIENIKFLASVQDLFVPLGVARNEAVDLSKSVVTLATDMASFNNLPTADVIRDIQSSLVGNHETVRKYGVVLSEATVDQELLNMGIEGGNKAATAAEKALARLNLIMAGTTDAQGDAIRTADSFTNRFVALKSSVIDLSESFGNLMLPTLQKIVSSIIKAVQYVENLTDRQKKLILIIAGLAAAAGPLLIVVGKLVALFAALSGPAGWVVLGTIALIALTVAMSDETAGAAESARWHKTLANNMIIYKKAVEETTDAIEALSQKQITVREREVLSALRRLKSDQELLGKTIERNQQIIELERELIELRKWRFIKDIELNDAEGELNETTSKYNIALVNEANELKKVNDQLTIQAINYVEIENKLAEAEAKREAQREMMGAAAISTALGITGALSTIWGNYYAGKTAEQDKELRQLQENLDAGLISEEEFLEGKKEIESEKRELQHDAAVTSRNFSLFEATIGAAQAIISGFTTKPFWPVGLAMGALASALAGVQLAAIASTPIPALAEGGIVTQPTLALIGEAGPERVTPLGAEPIHVTVMVGSKVLYDDITKGIKNRQIRIEQSL